MIDGNDSDASRNGPAAARSSATTRASGWVHVMRSQCGATCSPSRLVVGAPREISAKYDQPSVRELFRLAGLRLVEWATDPDALYALALAAP